MSRAAWRYWGVGALSACLVLLFAAWVWARAELSRPYAGWEGEAVVVSLEPGLAAGSMLLRLEQAGVVRRAWLLHARLALLGGAERLHAGEYRFDEAAPPLDVLQRLQRGDVWLHPVTLPEGLTLFAVAGRLEQAGLGAAEDFLAVFGQPALVQDLDSEAQDLEGYLFPDTYHFPRSETPARIAAAMVQRFREVVGEAYAAQAEKAGLDLRDAVVLGSLIERETSLAEERARVSRVFHNRLERGMRLECDPTVIYALARAGRSVEALSREDLAFESPWNTYVVRGLPVGPIANPGQASLMAAVQPVDGDEIYFVAAPGGGHRFSKTLSEHLRAVREWRRYRRSSE